MINEEIANTLSVINMKLEETEMNVNLNFNKSYAKKGQKTKGYMRILIVKPEKISNHNRNEFDEEAVTLKAIDEIVTENN
jgi:hypothetical protein